MSPICPLEAKSMEDAVWYPNEDICTKRYSDTPHWIQVQRRLKKSLSGILDSGYFTCKMMNATSNVSKGTRGIDPDRIDHKEAEEQWILLRHRHVRTPEELAALRERGFKLSKRLLPAASTVSA
jgi:hypothetical protein